MLEYTVDGRKVSHEQFMKHVKDSAIGLAETAVQERIAQIRCPVHGKAPKARPKSRAGDVLEFDVTGCCQQVIRLAQDAIR